jgi:hypothetical protein
MLTELGVGHRVERSRTDRTGNPETSEAVSELTGGFAGEGDDLQVGALRAAV